MKRCTNFSGLLVAVERLLEASSIFNDAYEDQPYPVERLRVGVPYSQARTAVSRLPEVWLHEAIIAASRPSLSACVRRRHVGGV